MRARGYVALVVDSDTGDHLYAAEGHDGGLSDAVFSPNGRWLATASDDNTAKVYEADTGRLRFTLFGHTDQVFDLDWSPDSNDLLTAGVDGLAKLWEISDAGPMEVLTFSSQDLRGGVGGVAFSPDGGKVITAQYTDLAVKIWDIGLGGDREWANFPADGAFPGLAYSLDADRLAASMGQGSIGTWEVGNADPVGVTHLPQHGMILGLAISADGTLAAGAGGGGTDVWDVKSGQLRFTVVPDGTGDTWNQAVAWSPVADILATASVAGPLRIVDSMGETLETLDQGPGVGVCATAFSPDGNVGGCRRGAGSRRAMGSCMRQV